MATVTIDDVQLDPKISYGFKKYLMYKTTVFDGQAGIEQRIGRRSICQRKWVFEKLLKKTPMKELESFFYARRANLYGFRWKDWTDYDVTAEALENPFPAAVIQLTKFYDDDIRPTTRSILKPIASEFHLLADAVEVDPGDYTLDDATGLVTLDSAPANGDIVYTWTGEFDVPVRFMDEEMSYTMAAQDQYDAPDLTVLELLAS